MHIVVLTTWGIWQYIFYMLSSEDILEFLRSAQHRIKFISVVKNTRGFYLGNLTLTKIQSINSETPCVHVDRCSETYEWNRIISHSSHMVALFFWDTGKTVCVRVLPNSPIKKYRSKKPSTKRVLRKGCRENPHKHFWLWDALRKIFEENIAKS